MIEFTTIGAIVYFGGIGLILGIIGVTMWLQHKAMK